MNSKGEWGSYKVPCLTIEKDEVEMRKEVDSDENGSQEQCKIS